jgi:hypothetical protein
MTFKSLAARHRKTTSIKFLFFSTKRKYCKPFQAKALFNNLAFKFLIKRYDSMHETMLPGKVQNVYWVLKKKLIEQFHVLIDYPQIFSLNTLQRNSIRNPFRLFCNYTNTNTWALCFNAQKKFGITNFLKDDKKSFLQ